MAEEIAIEAEEAITESREYDEYGDNINEFSEKYSEKIRTADSKEAAQELLEEYNAKVKEISLKSEKKLQEKLKDGIEPENIDKIFDSLENMKEDINGMKNQIDQLKNEVGQEVLDKFHETLKGRFEALDKSTTEVLEKILESGELKEVKGQLNELNDYAKESSKNLEEMTDEEIKNLTENIDEKFEELNNKLDEKVKTQVEGEMGVDGYNKFKSIMKYGSLLRYGLGILAAFFALKAIAGDLTGCYQYKGTECHKIDYCDKGKPSTDCNCGPEKNNDITNTNDLQKLCNSSENKNYPYCTCGVSPDKPTCSSVISADNTSVYYSYKEFSPTSIIASIPNDIGKIDKLIPKGIKNFLMQMMKIILMIGGTLLLFYLIFIIVSGVIKKRNNK